MILQKIKEELENWFNNNVTSLLKCEINEKQIIKYIYSAKSKQEYMKQWKYIKEQLDSTVQSYVRYQNSNTTDAWVTLKRINPLAPEHAILKDRKKDVRVIWKLR